MLRGLLCASLAGLILAGNDGGTADRAATASTVTIDVQSPMAPPHWALMQRELLRANEQAVAEFYAKYFDERGYLLCVERWGGDDGPDDAIECCAEWPLLVALGGSDDVLRLYQRAWEGHLRQYTQARTVEVPLARDGMYYKEFPVMMDWVHNGEGLRGFCLEALCNSADASYERRARRFAGFYLNEDEGAQNYDAQRRIIRSMFNGSRGPLLRKATALDWAGDPIEIENRFQPRHGERNFEQMLAHFKDYTDIVGDHPQNLAATTLALNAYLLTGEAKYKDWLLEYVDAWRERMGSNGGIIPSKIGLDGAIGVDGDGRWYGGVYGWGFSVVDPATGAIVNRNTTYLGIIGFMNAFLLTGDDKYLEPWRRQIQLVNAQAKEVDGASMYPTMYGESTEDGQPGWYGYRPERYAAGAVPLRYFSMRPDDAELPAGGGWFDYVAGKSEGYAEARLAGDLARIRARVAEMRADPTTPDTRLADDPLMFTPASVSSLVELMLGGLPPDNTSTVLFCRLRYFDPAQRRAGIPPDVAALVTRMTADTATLTLVNTSQLEAREVVVQAGGYAEHEFVEISDGETTTQINGSQIKVRLAPGAGRTFELRMRCYVNQPTARAPWDR